MSLYSDQIKNDKDLPITYSINIKTLSTSKRPLTCCITTASRISKQRGSNQLNYIKPLTCLDSDKTKNFRTKSTEINRRSSIHLPVTYSSSIHIPCHPSNVTLRSPLISPTQSSHHHYHHYHHHYYHHHHRQPSLSSRPSTAIKNKKSPQTPSIDSTRPTTTSTTNTSPESLLPSKKLNKSIATLTPINKQPPPHPPLPSYSSLVWNWFHHTPIKTQAPHKGSQSDYSETYRHDLPRKRSLLFKLLTSPTEKQSKSKHHRTCFTRKRFESSSSLPNKINNYNE